MQSSFFQWKNSVSFAVGGEFCDLRWPKQSHFQAVYTFWVSFVGSKRLHAHEEFLNLRWLITVVFLHFSTRHHAITEGTRDSNRDLKFAKLITNIATRGQVQWAVCDITHFCLKNIYHTDNFNGNIHSLLERERKLWCWWKRENWVIMVLIFYLLWC